MSSVSSGWITIGCQSGRIPSGPWLNFLRDAIVIQTWSFWTSRKFLNNVQIFLNIVQKAFDPPPPFIWTFVLFCGGYFLNAFLSIERTFATRPPSKAEDMGLSQGSFVSFLEERVKEVFTSIHVSVESTKPAEVYTTRRWHSWELRRELAMSFETDMKYM